MKREMITLDDKYTVTEGRAFLTGTQALVRLPMLQRMRDTAAGLDTAGFVSGYRGSPLGNLDLQLWKGKEHLRKHQLVFQPGVNEDLAATAVWGTQQVGLFPGAKHAGVFAMWYGKGPGVDRCGDVFRHVLASGGGWGDPFARDPALVLEDVRMGRVSAAGARRDYGVAIADGAAGLAVDAAATVALRAAGRAAP